MDYFGKGNLGNEDKSSSSSSSSKSRSGIKKLNHSADHHKPNKQPQRGLGVAQLEKIRLQSIQMGICSTTHESERAYNINYSHGSQLITPTPRWNPSSGMVAENQMHFADQTSMTGQYFYTMQLDQGQLKKEKKNGINNNRPGNGMDSEMEEKHELDLELRLSL